jgi:GNAT superfamily N-acetyltransferase
MHMGVNSTQPARIEPLQAAHLPLVGALVNAHLGLLAPGWALTDAFIAGRLARNPSQAITDPWVVERVTLCALQDDRLMAAAHLLRYGRGPAVSASYHGAGEIAWFLAWTDAVEAASALLRAAHEQMTVWQVAHEYAWGIGLPVGPFVGVPDVWPHISAWLAAAGFQAWTHDEEVVYGGSLGRIPAPAMPPLPGLTVQRRLVTGHWAQHEFRFAALVDGREIGRCEVALDLTENGALPSLRDWAELTALEVDAGWRGRGIGTWLVRHAATWLRLGGRKRIILATMLDNTGARRFYERLGWELLVREHKGWELAPGVLTS